MPALIYTVALHIYLFNGSSLDQNVTVVTWGMGRF